MFSRIIVKFVGFILAVFPYTLLLLRILKNGWSKVFKVIPRSKPPKALSDPSLGRHGFITTEDGISFIRFQFSWKLFFTLFLGVRLHYVENGDRSQPLMLFLHGFPEFWFSWRNQLKYFSSKGYYCVAFDLRGYNDSDKPKGIRSYGLDYLTSDVKAIIDGLGKSSCTLVGKIKSFFLNFKWHEMNVPHFSQK